MEERNYQFDAISGCMNLSRVEPPTPENKDITDGLLIFISTIRAAMSCR